jgi:hypothetical protein
MVDMSHRPPDHEGTPSIRRPSDRPADDDTRIGRAQVDFGLAELLRDADRPRAWLLVVDGTAQSYVDLDDPRYLEFEYMRRIGHVADLAAPPGRSLRVLHLGGGGLSLARYVAATRPGSDQVAVDRDAKLVEFVRQRLPLDQPPRRAAKPGRAGRAARAGRIRVRVADARAELEQARPGSFDLVVADLFAGATTAPHLTSAEFATGAARALTAKGIFVVNIGDGPPLTHARARIAATQTAFGHCCVLADAGVMKGRRFGNLVLAAAHRPLPTPALERLAAGDPFPGKLLYGDELDRFVAGAKPITDAEPKPSPAPPAGVLQLRPSSPGKVRHHGANQR